MNKVSFDSARQFLANGWNAASQAVKKGSSDSVIWVQKTANANPLTTILLANTVATVAVKTIVDKFSGQGTSDIKKRALRVTAFAVLVGGNYLLLGSLGLSITTLPVALAVGSGVVIGLLVVSYRDLRNENKRLEEELECLNQEKDLLSQSMYNYMLQHTIDLEKRLRKYKNIIETLNVKYESEILGTLDDNLDEKIIRLGVKKDELAKSNEGESSQDVGNLESEISGLKEVKAKIEWIKQKLNLEEVLEKNEITDGTVVDDE